jgi:hypothetical protein
MTSGFSDICTYVGLVGSSQRCLQWADCKHHPSLIDLEGLPTNKRLLTLECKGQKLGHHGSDIETAYPYTLRQAFVMFAITLALILLPCRAIYVSRLTPLARLPCANQTCSIMGIWILWKRYGGSAHELKAIAAAHERHGPVVRLGPNEISIVSLDLDERRIFSMKLEKPPWYTPFSNYG